MDRIVETVKDRLAWLALAVIVAIVVYSCTGIAADINARKRSAELSQPRPARRSFPPGGLPPYEIESEAP